MTPHRAAERMALIEPFHVMEVMAMAQAMERSGRDVVHMEVGEPDFPTAGPIVEAGVRALREDATHYTLATGLPALRESIANFYAHRYGCEVAPERIVITVGASGAFQLALWPVVQPGDEVLLVDPGYPCNANFVRLAGAQPVLVPTHAEEGWRVSAEALAAALTPRTRAIILASPANPTGVLVQPTELEAIAALARQHGITLISDEIYHGLVYGEEARTAADLDGDLFVINSFSKYFGMTGWRLGWLVVPQARLRDVEKLAQNLFISPPTPAQHAALAAFQPETIGILETRRRAFQERRDFLAPAIRELGFGLPTLPGGAFYLYADCAAFSTDSATFAKELLAGAGVAVTPGLDFGPHSARQHVRLAYTTSLERIQEGVSRMREFLSGRT
ncbi:MAG: pyridoxal phosphate-dependent aminotransferase [Pseudomonadota bacterium]|nr:pyridoxal phosphate-dependent aminotransferase [Pseudomonadota bacterium]